jgi:hypothetical protein
MLQYISHNERNLNTPKRNQKEVKDAVVSQTKEFNQLSNLQEE